MPLVIAQTFATEQTLQLQNDILALKFAVE